MKIIKNDIASAVHEAGLKDGGRISFHHHLRMGDRIVEQVLPVLTKLGYKELTLCASSLMGTAGAAVLEAVRAGTVKSIETTGLKEPLASAVQRGEVPHPVVFRTHGGRARAIMSGKTPIDVAFIGASIADRTGNANGTEGPNRFGSLGYGQVDAEFAVHVIILTDFLVDQPLHRVSIPSAHVDQVILLESIGVKSEIGGGSLRKSSRPLEQFIAGKALELLIASGEIADGFNFQAGSGGISLLVSEMLAAYMEEKTIKGGFSSGGVTGALAGLLKRGLFHNLYDVQSFDDEAVQLLASGGQDIEMSASRYANPDHPGGCIVDELDVMILSATEVDCDFNVNSLTGSDGRILGALGGAPDTAAGSDLTVVVLPSFRGRIPTIRRNVNTICTPGRDVDIIVTERGFLVNPARPDLIECFKAAGHFPDKPEDLMNRIYQITGVPTYPQKGIKVVGTVEYRDGSLLDEIRT